MPCILSIDVGTTSIKALVIDERGELRMRRDGPLATFFSKKDYAEQSPEDIWTEVNRLIESVTDHFGPSSCAAIVLGTAMHGLIAMDASGNTLTPMMLWSDSRATNIAEHWRHAPDAPRYFAANGVPMHPMLPSCKIAWLREHEPHIFEKTSIFADLKSFLVWKLTGKWLIDYSMATAMGLFDLQVFDWHAPSLYRCGISKAQLPTVCPTDHFVDIIHSKYAHIPLIVGSSDGCLANLGSGVLDSSSVSVTMGTSGAVRTTIQGIQTDPLMRTFCYPLDHELSMVGGGVNSGSIILDWARSHFFANQYTREEIEQMAASATPGAAGLQFKPYLMGERAPIWNPRARGGFSGIHLGHEHLHFARAIWEGLALNLTVLLQIIETMHPIEQIKASGGLAQSTFWLQLLADVSGKPVVQDTNTEASALGGAFLAMKALRWIENYQSLLPPIAGLQFEPNRSVRGVYDEALGRFRIQ